MIFDKLPNAACHVSLASPRAELEDVFKHPPPLRHPGPVGRGWIYRSPSGVRVKFLPKVKDIVYARVHIAHVLTCTDATFLWPQKRQEEQETGLIHFIHSLAG